MLVEWNPYIIKDSSRSKSGQSAGVDPVNYKISYGTLNSEEDDPVSTATSLSVILQMVFIF